METRVVSPTDNCPQSVDLRPRSAVSHLKRRAGMLEEGFGFSKELDFRVLEKFRFLASIKRKQRRNFLILKRYLHPKQGCTLSTAVNSKI
jgi:hypothetical protein